MGYTGRVNRTRVARLGVALLGAALLSWGCRSSGSSTAEPSQRPVQVAFPAACHDPADCEQKCSAGQAEACVEAGRRSEFAEPSARDLPKAYSLYERACTLGSATGCYNQGILLEQGKGIPRDARRALELFHKVCRAGSKTACARAEQLEAGAAGGSKP